MCSEVYFVGRHVTGRAWYADQKRSDQIGAGHSNDSRVEPSPGIVVRTLRTFESGLAPGRLLVKIESAVLMLALRLKYPTVKLNISTRIGKGPLICA